MSLFVAGCPQNAVDKIKGRDPDGIRQCLQFVFKATIGTKFPPRTCDQAVVDQALEYRGKNADTDRIELLKAILLPDGTLDWSKGCYRVEVNAVTQLCTRLQHKPTGDLSGVLPTDEWQECVD